MQLIDIIILLAGIANAMFMIIVIDGSGPDFKQQLLLLLPAIIATIIVCIIGIKTPFRYVDCACISLPIIVTLFYNLFGFLSWSIIGREFRIHIRGSRNLNRSANEQDHFHWTDHLFTFLLLIILMSWPVILPILFTHSNSLTAP